MGTRPFSILVNRLLPMIVTIVITPSSASAGPTYRWTDSAGRTTYGSNPPANARNVESVKARSFSKYSSSKLLKAYGKKDAPSETNDGAEPDAPPPSGPIPSKAIEIPKGVEPEVVKVTQPAQLDHSEVEVEHGPTKEITSCKVKVKNYGDEKATAIKVSFQFADGTLIPATGPESMQPSEEASFEIGKKNLPVKVSSDQAGILPEVIVDFASMPL